MALTPDQVRELRLPSTPLKATEKRASKWKARTGTEQTEIDAAIALRPGELGQIARDAIGPFFDRLWPAASGRPARAGRPGPRRSSMPGWTATASSSWPLPGQAQSGQDPDR